MISDLTVIDASSVLAGPSVATYFAELGARVIKIEHPNHPDVTRSWKLPSEEKTSSVSAYFSSINYKKEYLQLDLKNEKDHASFLKLVASADILVTNFKKGDDIKLKIEDEHLQAINSRLIHGKINGYGSNSDRVAYDLILQAESGFMSMNGTPESGPVKMPIAFVDVLAAHHLKEAILLALYQREKTGQGKTLSVSLYDAAVSSLVNQASNYLMANHVPQRIGSLHPNIAPYGELFSTKDGATITFAIGSDLHFKKLCSALETNSTASDRMYSDNQCRIKNRTKLAEVLQEKIGLFSCADILQKLQKLNVPAGKVKNLDEVFSEKAAQELVLEESIDGVETKRIKSVIFKEND
ncbi:MAG: CoA transferase [Fluviicola sp.]|nr:CoA transferase [Fluviicola sp.]